MSARKPVLIVVVIVLTCLFGALSAIFPFASCNPYGGMTPDECAAVKLAERVVPEYADNIIFCQTEDTLDVFEISSIQGKLLVKGNNANSMAVGLNHYLKHFCNVTVSWYATDRVQCPKQMPQVMEPVRVEARTANRFFLNYCTFGYTMPWWKWKDWERFIDWMALGGVNMPLANTGQEAIWQKVWRNHGLTDAQILSYFTGPAHLAWHRMTNIDHYGGPLPQHWIDSQVKLQKKEEADGGDNVIGLGSTLEGFGVNMFMYESVLDKAWETSLTDALRDMDALAACDPQLRLDKWLDDASACAKTPEEAAYYRRNARTIITIWGQQSSIRDYASRVWSGLIDSYYAPRWQMYVDEISACIKEGRDYDQTVFFEHMTEFENNWTTDDAIRAYRPAADYVQLSKELICKYFNDIK